MVHFFIAALALVLMAGEQNSAAGSPQRSISFNINGVSRLQNNTKLDGASVVYPWLPTNTAYVPSSEAIEEVSIVTKKSASSPTRSTPSRGWRAARRSTW